MAYASLAFNGHGRKHSHAHELPRIYESRRESRRGSRSSGEWKSFDTKHALDILSGVLYKRLFFIFHDVFNRLRSYLPEPYNSARDFEERLFASLDNVFNILEDKTSIDLEYAFQRIKDTYRMTLVLERTYFIIQRAAIKSLATHSRIKRFRKVIANSSKRNQLKYDQFKIRHFMGLCEGFLSKKYVPKATQNAFKNWHLQTVIRNLSIFCEDQDSLIYEQKKNSAKFLINAIQGHVREAWLRIRTHNDEITNNQLPLYGNLLIRSFVAKLSIVFLKGILEKFPFANIRYKSGLPNLYNLATGFDAIKRHKTNRFSQGHVFVKGAAIIAGILRMKLLQRCDEAFIGLNSYAITSANELKDMNEDKIQATENIIRMLVFLKKKKQYEFFQKLYVNQFENKKTTLALHLAQACHKLASIVDRKLDKTLSIHFYRWRSITSNLNPSEPSWNASKIAIKKLNGLLKHLIEDKTASAWNEILTFSMAKSRRPVEVKVPEKDTLILSTVVNQAMVNTKLDVKHKKRHQMWIQCKRQAALFGIMTKNTWRELHNKKVIHHFFRRWQDNISIDNTKIQEYAQYLNILETEILENRKDYISTGILNLDNIRVEMPVVDEGPESPIHNRHRDLSRQIRYLEFLEIQNSNLMEILTKNEREFEEEDVPEIIDFMEITRSRAYSI